MVVPNRLTILYRMTCYVVRVANRALNQMIETDNIVK